MKIVDFLRSFAHLTGIKKVPVFEYTAQTSEEVRKLQARVYVESGIVEKSQVQQNGVLDENTDAYYTHSRYFGLKHRSRLVAGGRLILPKKGYDSLQIAKHFKLDSLPAHLKNHAKKGSVCEISAIFKLRGSSRLFPMILLKEMLEFSRRNNHKVLFMMATVSSHGRLSKVLGEQLTEISAPIKVSYCTEKLVPCAILASDSYSFKNSQLKRREKFVLGRVFKY